MMPEFFSILTHAGAAKLALAAQTGQPMAISTMAVGDGAGATPTPSPEQTGLIGEQYRAALNALTIVSESANVISAEMIIPPEFGGFWIREVGLYADDGVLVAVGSLPDTYKSHLAEGSGRNSVIRVELAVSSTKDVQLLIDPTVIIATVDYVDTKFREAKNRADDAYALAEAKAAFDDIYPPGISIFFATNLNPNEKWPGTTWHYTGENKTIRIGKADGSDVMTAGGSDTVTLSVENMPKHSHGVSGQVGEFDHGIKSTSEFDYGTKRTSKSGKHAHHGVPKRNSDYELGGNNRVFFDPYQEGDTDEAGEHDHEMELGPHAHSVEIGPHAHGIDLTSDEVGGGQAFSIVESHIKLMCWYRAA
ncbi:phage tail protein [Serratia marcescens]|nr:phage tail protein [Serratia marcescens]MBN5438281.1 phage tail protein [Serratia marcescens]HEJ6944230.1 phage tail protein [Serratia marcescens]HEJ9120635.1 phage tail protein [Serratia marcescens]